jgi:hypothetical protein
MDVVSTWLVLAADNPFQTIQRYLNRPMASRWPELVGVLIALTVLLWVGLFAWEWRRRRNLAEEAAAPSSLIDQLSLVHGLDATAINIMQTAAVRLKLPDIALLFLDPRLLATSTDPAERALGLRLFGDLGISQSADLAAGSQGR